MKYFQTLPSIYHNDLNGNYVAVTNLLSRCYLLSTVKNSLYLFYDYNIKDYDKPESLAYNYYNDPYRYWQILYANNMFDPQGDWPKNYLIFTAYINDKYASEAANASLTPLAYTQSTIHHYEKIVTTYDDNGSDKCKITIKIDANTYTNLIPTMVNTKLNDGTTVTRKIEKTYVTVYDYEVGVNEENRKIKLIKDVYAIDMDKQLSYLMGN